MKETFAQRLESIRSSSQQPRPRLGCPVTETEICNFFTLLTRNLFTMSGGMCVSVNARVR